MSPAANTPGALVSRYQGLPAAECHGPSRDAADGRSQVEDDTAGLVEPPHEQPHLRTQDARQGLLLRRDDVNGEPPLAQRRGDLEADEARADDDDAFRGLGPGNEPAAVGERAQVVDL
jgi:hypothetical protein